FVIFLAAVLMQGRSVSIYLLLSIFSGVLIVWGNEEKYIPLYQPSPGWVATINNSYPKVLILLTLIGVAFYALRFLLVAFRLNQITLKQTQETLGKRTVDLSIINDQLRHEISERRQTESKLEQERAFLRQIIDTTPHYIFVKDKNGRFVIINKALATALKRTPAEIEGRSARDFNLRTQEIDRFEQGDQMVLETEEEIIWSETPFTDLDGNEHWLQVVKRPLIDKLNNETLVLGIATDITASKAIAESLREQEERYRVLVEASYNGIIICVDHIIEDANLNFATMFGYSSIENVLGKYAASFLTTESSAQLQEKMQITNSVSLEATGIRQDKSIFPLEIISHQINYQGKYAQIIGYRDISTRKQAEEAELHAQRLESLTLMAGGLAHDFNNLLVAMMGQISIAQAKIDSEHPALENLDKATKVTETAALLTRQLLAFTGQGHFQVASIHLTALIQQNLQLFQDTLPANVTFKTNLEQHLPHIQADGLQIQQVIMNLLLNAVQAIGTQEGTITVTTAPYRLSLDEADQWQHFNHFITDGDFVLLEMADTGQGMDEETRNRIFDPFFSTKGTGRGLGLAAVLGIVRGHKGAVRAKSKATQGTTFQLLFPSDKAKGSDGETAVSQTHPQQKTVLVVDDERQVREAICDILDLEEIVTLTAANGEEGVAIFSSHQARIGLIILDLSMPGMSGIETFTALREIEPTAKIILSSGYTEAEILQKMAGTSPTEFLQKPYQIDTIISTVKKHLS
ncbi:PAS/PAC sensor hybrid histidine kinase, partial [hydrothermal vent metagenome]